MKTIKLRAEVTDPMVTSRYFTAGKTYEGREVASGKVEVIDDTGVTRFVVPDAPNSPHFDSGIVPGVFYGIFKTVNEETPV